MPASKKLVATVRVCEGILAEAGCVWSCFWCWDSEANDRRRVEGGAAPHCGARTSATCVIELRSVPWADFGLSVFNPSTSQTNTTTATSATATTAVERYLMSLHSPSPSVTTLRSQL
ncbi:hypothetical protein AB1N83_012289 [Pleurotus pulmonarius]